MDEMSLFDVLLERIAMYLKVKKKFSAYFMGSYIGRCVVKL